MIILSRQRDESIVIGDDLEIVVLGVLGDRVRIGIRTRAEGPAGSLEIGQTEPSVASPSVVNRGPDEIDDMDAHFG